jgi:hypothetical protein
MPKFDVIITTIYYYNLDAPMLHRTQPCGCGFTVYLPYHTHYNFYLLLHNILCDVDNKIKATLTKCIVGKWHVCKSARLKKYKFEKVQN